MNIIALIILITLVADYLLHLTADFLNLKMLNTELPESFKEFYSKEEYAKSQEYLKINTKFGWVASTFNIIIILLFWFCKGFPFLDEYVRAFEFGPVVTGIIYMGIIIIIKSLVSIPFNIYSTFVIEERFGFNKTTWQIFITDMIKGTILSIIIGVPLLAGILSFFEYTGDNAWWYCWITVPIFILTVQFIAPTWILPLFNKFNPVEDGELKNAIMTYAKSINYSLEKIFVMDGSKRSAKSNAFFTGFGKHKRIVLFDTLVEQLTTRELVSVLAHEMGHYKKKHIQKIIIFGIIQMGIMFYLLSFFLSYKGLFDAFYINSISIYSGLIFFGLLYSPIDFLIGIFLQIISRKNEYEADKFATLTTKDNISMGSALRKLSARNLANLYPHPLYVFLNYSHPPILDRLTAIKTN